MKHRRPASGFFLSLTRLQVCRPRRGNNFSAAPFALHALLFAAPGQLMPQRSGVHVQWTPCGSQPSGHSSWRHCDAFRLQFISKCRHTLALFQCRTVLRATSLVRRSSLCPRIAGALACCTHLEDICLALPGTNKLEEFAIACVALNTSHAAALN